MWWPGLCVVAGALCEVDGDLCEVDGVWWFGILGERCARRGRGAACQDNRRRAQIQSPPAFLCLPTTFFPPLGSHVGVDDLLARSQCTC